jgi:hypothetical protein
MQRARRLALVAVLPLLGALALAGCRSEPGIAAYAGSTKYTVKQVDALAAEGRDKVAPDFGVVRQRVLSWLLIRDIGQAEAKKRGLALEPQDPAAVAAQAQLQPNSPLAQLYVDVNAVLSALDGSVTPVEPTEADQRELYGHLTINGAPVTNTFDDAKKYLTKEVVGPRLALRSTLVELLKQADVVVNPLYAPLTYPIPVPVQNATAIISVPLSGVATSPVTEASASA